MEKHFMTNTVYTSLETFSDIVAMVEERARLITAMKADKLKLVKSSLEMKVQSSRYFTTQINAINAKIEGLQGKTIMGV
jgi:acetolactate synthase regulatory subunit